MFESMRRAAAFLSGPNLEADRSNLCDIRFEHKKAPPKEKPNWENSFQSGVKAYANKHHNGSLPDALMDLLKNCPPGGTAIMELVPAKWWERPKKATTSVAPDRSRLYSYPYYRGMPPTALVTPAQRIPPTFPSTPTMPVRTAQAFDWARRAVSTQVSPAPGQPPAPFRLPFQVLPSLTGAPRSIEVSRKNLAWLVGRATIMARVMAT